MDVPPEVHELISRRAQARKDNNYTLSDELRAQLVALGYEVEDHGDTSTVRKVVTSRAATFLVVFGSGETSSIGRKIHEHIFTQIGKKDITIGIITTPAGFQPNVVTVHEEIRDFFIESLANFHPTVRIVYANTKEDADNADLVASLDGCDYLFMGPGSPTYAVSHLKDTLLLKKIIDLVTTEQVSLCLSSAAALAFSEQCLPVYEIYKVGAPLHWIKGLNIYKVLLDQELTIIPHFDNTEGGAKNDTSHCYLGKNRFTQLLGLFTASSAMLGIDEQTAQIWDLHTNESLTMGKGKVTPIHQ